MSVVALRSGASTAEIATLGAELRSWSVDGRPLIWTPDPTLWANTAPLLFPVVGWTRGGQIRVHGVTYPLGLHGFARTMTFRLAERSVDHARLVLEATPESRALYPFDFVFAITYRLADTSLGVTLSVRNTGPTKMPYACGLHPGFLWPFDGGDLDDYTIAFARDEEPAVPVISDAGLFTRARRSIPLDGRRLALSAALMAGEALCFLDAKSRSLRFVKRDGAAITIRIDGFPHIALWSKPAGRFLSIEAWTGHGDCDGGSLAGDDSGEGEFATKASMIHLAPGEVREHAAVYGFDATRPKA